LTRQRKNIAVEVNWTTLNTFIAIQHVWRIATCAENGRGASLALGSTLRTNLGLVLVVSSLSDASVCHIR